MRNLITTTLLIIPFIFSATAQFVINGEQKISDTEGGFAAILDDSDIIGGETVSIGDLDGDGVTDVAFGTTRDDDGGADAGCVYIVFLNTNGTVKDFQKISATEGNFGATLETLDHFGVGLANLGDVNGDGVQDIAVGAYDDDDGGTKKGSVYIIFLNTDGTVNSYQKISDTQGNFSGVLNTNDEFGRGVAGLGDLNGDNVPDVAVGCIGSDDGGTNHGAVYILFLNANGTVSSYQKISSLTGNFSGILESNGYFGFAIANMGDINNDSVIDIAVTHRDADVNGTDKGEVFLLFMNSNGTVNSHQRITEGYGGFGGTLTNNEKFGWGLENGDDLNNDGVNDMLVGLRFSSDGGLNRGGFYILYLDSTGTVISEQWFSSTQGGITGPIDDGDYFGTCIGSLGDLNGDGTIDLLVGATGDDDGGTDRGAAYILFQQSTESLTENDIFSHINIYPNPVTDELVIDASFDHGIKVDYTVYDVVGRVITGGELPKYNEHVISTSDWKSGTYLIQFSDGHNKFNASIVKK